MASRASQWHKTYREWTEGGPSHGDALAATAEIFVWLGNGLVKDALGLNRDAGTAAEWFGSPTKRGVFAGFSLFIAEVLLTGWPRRGGLQWTD